MMLLDIDNGQSVGVVGDCWALGPMVNDYVASNARIVHRNDPNLEVAPADLLLASNGEIVTDCHTFSSNGKWVAFGAEEGAVFVLNLSDVRGRVATLYSRVGREKTPFRMPLIGR